jgi:hypothetical protein
VAAGDRHEEGAFDPVDVWRVLLADDEDERGAMLERLAHVGESERAIAAELADLRPLACPERFESRHRVAMRAIEVLDRHGPEPAAMPRLGPLRVVARPIVSLLTGWIVRRHRDRLIEATKELYATREAASATGSDEQRMLRRSRQHVAHVEETLRGGGFALPTFLLGGAVLTSAWSTVRELVGTVFDVPLGYIVVLFGLAVIVGGLAWCALYAAGVAHRRIRLATEQPFAELWEAIGNCGPAPDDHAYQLALLSVVLVLLAWLAVPLLTWLVF